MSQLKNNYSPLRYPGGKSKLINYIKKIILENDLENGMYIEPFSGGSSIALSLAMDNIMQQVVINDYDRSIYAFWYSVLNNTDQFIDNILNTNININEWHKQREVQKYKKTADLFELGFSTFYLNRTNRSGIIKAGVIGGLEQSGNYKINARFNKLELINRILKISEHRDRIKLFNFDVIDLLNHNKKLPKKNLVYLDPPYYVKGRNLYVNFYNDLNHQNLAQYIQTHKTANWVVSYDSHLFIENLYRKTQSIHYDLSYSAGATKSGKEVIFFKDNLIIPDVINPSKLKEAI